MHISKYLPVNADGGRKVCAVWDVSSYNYYYFRETVKKKHEMSFSGKGIISKYSEVKSYGS